MMTLAHRVTLTIIVAIFSLARAGDAAPERIPNRTIDLGGSIEQVCERGCVQRVKRQLVVSGLDSEARYAFVSMNHRTGERLWSRAIQNVRQPGGAMTQSGRNLFAVTGSDDVGTSVVVSIDARSGDVLWNQSIEHTRAEAGRYVFVRDDQVVAIMGIRDPIDPEPGVLVVSFDSADGTRRWEATLGANTKSRLAFVHDAGASHEAVYVAGLDDQRGGFILAMDIRSGRALWAWEVRDLPGYVSPSHMRTIRLEAKGRSIIVSGHLAAETTRMFVSAIDANDGRRLWDVEREEDGLLPRDVLIIGGRVFVASRSLSFHEGTSTESTTLNSYDRRTGKALGQTTADLAMSGRMVRWKNRILIGGSLVGTRNAPDAGEPHGVIVSLSPRHSAAAALWARADEAVHITRHGRSLYARSGTSLGVFGNDHSSGQ